MENTNYNPPLLQYLVSKELFTQDPFTLVDVGCALGIDPAWRLFGKQLQAYCFDPQVDECARLAGIETNPNVRYIANFVGLPDTDPFRIAAASDSTQHQAYYNPIWRSSAFSALSNQVKEPKTDTDNEVAARTATETWQSQRLPVDRVSLDEFVRSEHIAKIDFIKTDTDGSDLEVLTSGRAAIKACNVLGFMVETHFHGSYTETSNSLHNIDRFMKKNGFMLYGLTVKRYSRASLPATFVYNFPYETTSGQPIWGDLLFFRDGSAPDYEAIWGDKLAVIDALKLACLYELFCLPDCAAELISTRRREIAEVLDPDELLDILTPPLHGRTVSYQEYIAQFSRSYQTFFPQEELLV